MTFTIEHEQENDGRWLAEVLELPGVLAYGDTAQQAISRVQALALHVLADKIEHTAQSLKSVLPNIVDIQPEHDRPVMSWIGLRKGSV
ncbi:MAG: type II toxin-antitoxin system HicB family antitoxin [Pseudomonadota bacterium]